MIPNPSSDPLRRLQTPLVPEIKAEIGAALKAARLKKGQSLEAVGQQTRISKRFLEALEENRFEEFPALAYLRGFLKSYCDYLDLEFETFWRVIQSDPRPEPPQKIENAPAPSAPPALEPALRAAPAPSGQEADPGAAWRAVLLAVLLAAGSAFLLSRQSAENRYEGNRAPAAAPLLQPAHQPSEPRLLMEIRRDCWLSVSADGRLLFEGLARRNARRSWQAKKTLVLRTPTPEVLALTLNDARYSLPAPDASGAYVIETP